MGDGQESGERDEHARDEELYCAASRCSTPPGDVSVPPLCCSASTRRTWVSDCPCTSRGEGIEQPDHHDHVGRIDRERDAEHDKVPLVRATGDEPAEQDSQNRVDAGLLEDSGKPDRRPASAKRRRRPLQGALVQQETRGHESISAFSM